VTGREIRHGSSAGSGKRVADHAGVAGTEPLMAPGNVDQAAASILQPEIPAGSNEKEG
jgi:hypothetical protein